MPGRSFYSLNPLVWQPWNDPNYYINLPSGTTQGTKTIGQLEYSKKGKNNVYFNSNSDTDYHNWHALNIVLPFLLSIDPDLAKNIDFQNLSLRTLDRWNNIGGVDYFNRTPQDRKKLLEGKGVKEYLDEFITNPILNKLDQIVGLNRSSSTYPKKPFPNGDSFSGGLIRTTSDPYFGNLMANRRPVIHVSVNDDIRLKVFDYYKNLGYTGVYKYSDHWIPTVNENEAEIKFNTPPSELNTSATEILNLPSIQPVTILTPSETLGNPKINLPDLHSSIIRKPLDNGDLKANSNKFDYGKYILKQVPNLLEAVRLAGNLINNLRVYDATLKGINPNLQLGYNLYRQITGDEATKLGYYRRAVLGENLAARPVTSDIDKLIAYQMEAKRVGDELRALGDLADNAEIRRTSDESNLLSWGNRQRAAEVANRNTIELNNAIAAKLNLLALKSSADWTNWDTYLQGIEYRARQLLAKRDALNDLLYQLDEEWRLNNDPRLKDAIKELDDAWEASKQNKEDPRVKAAQEKVRNIQIELAKERIQRYLKEFGLSIFKSGGKTTKTYKWKDDLLYKTAKDTIEHFRKMSKLADDSRLKSRTKPIKFSSHTRKMQLGGVAPFTVFRPIALGGETSLSTTTGGTISSGEKESSSKKSESLEFIKKLFSDMASNKGLPIDVSLIANKILKTFDYSLLIGKELSTSDIASMYISSMLLLSLILHGKELYEDAKKIVTSNDAMDEYAVTGNGNYIVQDKNGNIKEATLLEIAKNNLTPVKNSLLLWMRGFAPNMALEKGDTIMSMFANNAIGMSKIAEYIKAQLPKLSSTELTLLGLTRSESNNVKKGILNLLEEAPSGIYEYTEHTKSNSDLAKAALSYINSILPENMKAVLKLHAAKEGSTVEKLIATLLSTLIEDVLSYKIDAVTGVAAKGKDGNNKGDNLEINYALKLLTGIGEPLLESFGIGNNNSFLAFGRSSVIAKTDANEEAFGADFSYNELYKSGVGKILNLDNASFGDVPINKAMKDSIIVDNSRIVGVDLPYTRDSSGRIIPNFKMLTEIEKADKEAMLLNLNPENPNDINKINLIYVEHKLPIKYKGTNLLTDNYIRFAVILATASEDAFLNKEGLSSNKTLTLVSDDQEINKYVRLMKEITKDTKYSLDRPGIFSFGNKDIYKGSIFIPITGDITDATLAGGASKMTTGVSTNLEILRDKWHTRNYVAPPEINMSKK